MTEAFDRLVAALARLPGIGRRSAERMAQKLVREPDQLSRELAEALQDARKQIRCCSTCGHVTDASRDPCRLCTDPGRDGSVLCVVEDPNDIAAIERSGGFHGRYHAMMGKLSPMKGKGVDDLRVTELVGRIKDEGIKEVILALSTDMEGDATAALIQEHLKDVDAQVTRLAFGLPAGSGIMYSDPVTLQKAIRGRMDV